MRRRSSLALVGSISVAALGLLIASPGALYGQQKDKEEHGRSSQPARGGGHAPAEHQQSRHESAPPRSREAPAARPAPQNPAPAARQAQPQNQPSDNSGRRFGRTNPDNSPRQSGGNPSYNPNSNSRPAGGQNPQPSGRQFGQQPAGRMEPARQPVAPMRPNTSPSPSPRFDANTRPGQPGGYHGPTVVRTPNGGQVYRGPGGHIREVHTANGAIIHHAPDGIRRVEVVRPGGRVVVASAHGYGYVQRPLVVRNVTYVQRTYVVHGVPYARVYRPWVWGGVTFHVYTPIRYYRPAFYSWAWSPWPRPVYYSWGWSGRPWFGFYAGYFTPYPYYASPALWLTDYIIASTLEQAYEERMAANAAAAQAAYYPPPGGQVALTPEVKQAIADEVHRQLEQERREQQAQNSGNAPPLWADGGSHVFVVSAGLEVNDGGMSCALTEGDVLQMNGAPAPGSPMADVVVLASKGQDCRKGSRVQVSLNDLQEMANQMRATLDQGLNDLQTRQGQNGLPPVPSNIAGGVTSAPFASEVKADPNVTSEITQAAQEAERGEQDVVSQAGSAATASISLGMSIGEVEQAFGRPREVADLGAKKVYVYNNLKVIFVDGKVTDVQ